MDKVIALTGGGTAGHILPSIALKTELQKHFNKIIYIGSEKGQEVGLCAQYNLPLFCVDTVKFERKKLYKNLKIPMALSKGIKQAKKILLENKVDVVFSKGGYVALPTVFAAYKLKIPVVIHESDATYGLANKVTKKRAKKVITSFKTTELGKNAVWLGNPIRDIIFAGNGSQIQRKYNLNDGVPTLLIFGGSLGSVTINQAVTDSLPSLTEKYQVIHITGKNKIDSSAKRYHTLPYANDIQNYLACADIVISRAGAGAALEIMALRKKVLFIPLEKSGRGDQVDNAKYYSDYKGVRVLREKELNSENLLKELEILSNSEENNFIFDKNTNAKIVKEIVLATNNR